MSAQRLYDVVGLAPMDDRTLGLAVDEWMEDNPGDELSRRAVAGRLRRLNTEAVERTEAEAAGVTVTALREARAEKRAREREARHQRDLDAARRLVALEDIPAGDAPAKTERSYPSLPQIEAERRRLALDGKPHGLDALGGKGAPHPFPGQRSTIRRRYEDAGLPPPGVPIPGICEHARPHQHPATRAPGTR